jgi:hypothetical protein
LWAFPCTVPMNMKLVTKYQISAINSCWENCDKNEHICSMCIKINKVGKQEVGIWWIQKCFPRYGVPIWSLWPNMLIFRRIFLSNYWCQISDIWSQASYRYPILFGKQEAGIWWVQNRFPQYGIPIWSLWPNIRFLSSIVAEKNATKNVSISSQFILFNQKSKV